MANNLLKQFGGNLPANINNTNNTNNTNDINNTNNKINNTTLCHLGNERVNETSSFPLGKPKEEDNVSHLEGVRKLPAEWRGVKLDLFCNGVNLDGSAQMKLNVGVLRHSDGAQIALQASLNSAFDDAVRRGVDKTQWNSDSHWISVKKHRKELQQFVQDVRISKIGKKSKHGGTTWVAFVYCIDCDWCVDIVRDAEIYHFTLNQKLSAKQLAQGNMIATGYFGERKQTLIDPKKEWGI